MNLLGRARSFFHSVAAPTAARVQYFSVICPQGHRMRGQRTKSYQALRCPACGEGVFVLPASPLPEPVPPARTTARPAAGGRMIVEEGPVELTDPARVTVDVPESPDRSDEIEILWEDEAKPEPKAAPRRGSSEKREPRPDQRDGEPTVPAGDRLARVRPASVPNADEVATAGSEAARLPESIETSSRSARPRPQSRRQGVFDSADAAVQSQPGDNLDSGPTRLLRPHHRPLLISAGLILVILAAVALRSWHQHRQDLPMVAATGWTEGITALEAGKLDHAHQLLSAAAEAVDALGGGVEHADEIRHAAEETALLVDLLPDTLESLLEEAARASPQSWATRFDDLYKGRAVVIDASITATPETSRRNCYELDYLVLAPGESARGQPRYARIDLSGFEAVTLARGKVGDRIVFGGRLESFQYDTQAQEWLIRLASQSGVLFTHHKALEALGWPSGLRNLEKESRTD
ncbi:MAG: hypothetical protein JO161_03100 [Planctomycetaceae bacterium]|nr:hypothetical protein [Planctomycetaceae bacterium]